MKNLNAIFIHSIFFATLLPLLSGCEAVQDHTLTGALWGGGTSDYYKSATNAELKLFQRGTDKEVLVEYKEERENTGATRMRAYFLLANDERIRLRKKPHYLPISLSAGMEPIPVQTNNGTKLRVQVWAQLLDNARGFTLVRDGSIQGEYTLPVYKDTAEELKRVLLTPGTVTVDAVVWGTIGGVVVGVYAAYIYAGGSFSPN